MSNSKAPVDDWHRDAFEEDGAKVLVETEQLEKMKSFVQKHSMELQKIEEALGETMTFGWDQNSDPISLDLTPYEQTNMLELVVCKSKPVEKITTVFAALCQELDILNQQAEKVYYAGISMYGELAENDHLEGDSQIHLGKMFPFLTDCVHFIERIQEVIKNVIRQFSNFYHPRQKSYSKDMQLSTVWKYLSHSLVTLISFDELFQNNEVFRGSWAKYKRMMNMMIQDPATYNIDKEKILQFEKLMLRIKGKLMDGFIFESTINMDFEDVVNAKYSVRGNALFKEKFDYIIKGYFSDLNPKLGIDSTFGKRYIRVCGLYAFYNVLFPEKPDINFAKQVWEVYRVCPLVHISGIATWNSAKFLWKIMPMLLQSAKIPRVETTHSFRVEYLANLVKNFTAKVVDQHLRVSQWLLQMESNFTKLKDNYKLILQGLAYARTISDFLKKYLLLHFDLNASLPANQFMLIFKCFELLKSISMMYHRRLPLIAEALSSMMKRLSFGIQEQLAPAFNYLSGDRKNNPSHQRLDQLSAVSLAIQMMNGPPTQGRFIVFQLAFKQIPTEAFPRKDTEAIILDHLKYLNELSNLSQSIEQECDCSFIFYIQSLIPKYIEHIYSQPFQARKLSFFFASFRDIIPVIRKSIHENPDILLNNLKKDLEDVIKRIIILPLAHEIHMDLAFHIHHDTRNKEVERKMDGSAFQVRDLSPFLAVPKLTFADLKIDIKASVTHYINKTFYDLSAVTLFNWQSFGEMRSLAFSKYGLNLHQVHLPGQTLEQGLDILQIMREIESFVANYRYNLNNQIFIEKTSESNTLSVINVQHIANSIRTHGTGIMSTVVNVTFLFLKEKFHTFSHFLFDELIKSKLYRDGTTLAENRKESGTQASWCYPYELARKFQTYVRSLGLHKDKKTYLQKFLDIITEIGNSMGYVRMIRSGSMLYTSNSIQFVPDLNSIEPNKFEETVIADNLSPDTVAAAKNLDSVVNTLFQNFSSGADYFKSLVSVFAPEYRSAANAHLKNFYLIIPALTLTYIEGISGDKERFMKKGREEGSFTNDGFAIGVAYILKLLDQNKEFDSLNWFKSTVSFYKQEIETKNRDKDNIKISQLTKSKLSNELEEFQNLRFSFSSARIFFHD